MQRDKIMKQAHACLAASRALNIKVTNTNPAAIQAFSDVGTVHGPRLKPLDDGVVIVIRI